MMYKCDYTMNRKKMQIFAVSLSLVALMFMGQSGIIQAAPQLTQSVQILQDTLLGQNSDFIEGLELIAAEGSALITQYYQWSGEKIFPLDPTSDAFDYLDLLYIISSNQRNWHNYWPRSLWEFRDGATIVFYFSQGMEASLADSSAIIPAISTWMGTNLDMLYGVEVGGQTVLFYWGYMSAQNHTDFIIDEFYDVFTTGGYTNFITNDIIAASPVSVVGTGLAKQNNVWKPLAVTAFIQENGIIIDENDVHNMSINSAFGYSGPIRPSPNSVLSAISFKLPYVANVYLSYPKTDSLYPELTGNFKWTMKVGSIYERIPEDIYITYDMAVEELETFPQITANVDVDVSALQSPTDSKLNYTITLTNTGNEMAYNTTFAWEIGENEPEPKYIYVFDSETYQFDPSILKFYNSSSGLIVDSLALTEHIDVDNLNISLEISGWFTYVTNGSIVQPVSQLFTNITNGREMYAIDFEETLKSVYINKSVFNFVHSSNLQTLYENETFYVYDTLNQLPNGSSVHYWWAVEDLPTEADEFIIIGFNNTNNGGQLLYDAQHGFYWQINMTFTDNTSAVTGGITNVKDWIVNQTLESGEDLRWPPLGEFNPSVMFRYEDSFSREYFGFANGLVIQLYDNEAILKTIVSLNATIYEIGEIAEINVTVENIGDTIASNVQIQGFQALMGPDWQLRDITTFSEEESLPDINPGEKVTHTFIRQVATFLGIHPIGIVIDYTTEESEGFGTNFNRTDITDVASNLILAVVLPKSEKAGVDEPSYPTPEVNVSVTWRNINGFENITNGDIIEIRTEIKNIGDEATTIKAYSYFPTHMAMIDVSGAYNGQNFKVTDISGNTLTGYDEGFALDHPEWPISIAAVAGLHLAPEVAIVFYYRIQVTDSESLILPPVAVEYDSRYPMEGTSGIEGETEGGSTPFDISLGFGIKSVCDSYALRFSIQDTGSASSWTSYSDASLLAAFSAVAVSSTTSPQPPTKTTTTGIPGFTTLTSFIQDNMKLMIVVLAFPILVLAVREYKRSQK